MTMTIKEATANLVAQFDEAITPLLQKCGAVLSQKRSTNIYLSFINALQISFYIDAAGEPSEIRLSLVDDGLMVGWAGNNLLCTDRSNFDDQQICTVIFVAEVFKHKDEWISFIKGLNIQPLIDAERAQAEAEEHAKEEERKVNLAAYEAAGIVVGTKISDVAGNVEVVKRISQKKVQIGKCLYDKDWVGKRLRDDVWHVEN